LFARNPSHDVVNVVEANSLPSPEHGLCFDAIVKDSRHYVKLPIVVEQGPLLYGYFFINPESPILGLQDVLEVLRKARVFEPDTFAVFSFEVELTVAGSE
jgi:hypothetical protein